MCCRATPVYTKHSSHCIRPPKAATIEVELYEGYRVARRTFLAKMLRVKHLAYRKSLEPLELDR